MLDKSYHPRPASGMPRTWSNPSRTNLQETYGGGLDSTHLIHLVVSTRVVYYVQEYTHKQYGLQTSGESGKFTKHYVVTETSMARLRKVY